MALQQRETIVIRGLRDAGIRSLHDLKILDAGCGSGQELLRLLQWGAKPENLCGIEIIPERHELAQRLHPSMSIVLGNIAALPFADDCFDMVLQFTTFSSILEPEIRGRAAAEIRRVLVPKGHLVWYDFWLNPLNRDTRGIRPSEVRQLFPGYLGSLRRLTLAPPLARLVSPHFPQAARFLENFWPLQTHYLGVLQKPG